MEKVLGFQQENARRNNLLWVEKETGRVPQLELIWRVLFCFISLLYARGFLPFARVFSLNNSRKDMTLQKQLWFDKILYKMSCFIESNNFLRLVTLFPLM